MNAPRRSVLPSLLSLALIAGVIQPAAEAGPLEEAEQFHTETLHRFEETLAATKAVKTRLNSRLSGKLLQGLLETIISEEELSAPFEKSGSRLMELHQKFEKAYEEVRQGTMSFADFLLCAASAMSRRSRHI